MSNQEIEFMEKEHEAGFHTSDDWSNLKDKCPECGKIVAYYKTLPPTRDRDDDESFKNLDYHLTPRWVKE